MRIYFIEGVLVIQNYSMSSQMNGSFRIGKYQVDTTQVLGKGATGFVYKAFHSETFEPLAVKAINMKEASNEVTQYLLSGEKKALTTIKSLYVVKTYDVIQEKDYCYIVMQQCRGTLQDYIAQRNHLSHEEALQMFRKIVIGYTSIIQGLFIHRDLKTANIMLRPNGDPVVIDFGYCEMIMGKRPMIQYNVGSPSYMSPEAYSKSRYSEKSDIWALGIILYEMLTGKTLDQGIDIKQYFRMMESQGRVRLATDKFNPICKELLDLSLQVSIEKRATIHKLKYAIDKSLIPKMKVQLKKTQSDGAQMVPKNKEKPKSPSFNFISPRLSCQNLQNNNNQSVKTISSTSFKEPISSPNPNMQPNTQRNQQSLIYVPTPKKTAPSPHQPHSVLRRSLEKNGQSISMKKIVSFSHHPQEKPSFRKIPTLIKTTSLVNQYVPCVSLRII